MSSENRGICIVTRPPTQEADGGNYSRPIYKLADVLDECSNQVFVIGGRDTVSNKPDNSAKYIDVGTGNYTGIRIVDYLLIQLIISKEIVGLRSRLDVVYLHKGALPLILPVLTANLLGLSTLLIKLTQLAHNQPSIYRTRFKVAVKSTIERFTIRAVDAVIVFSQKESQYINNKTYVAFSNFVDHQQFDRFKSYYYRSIDITFVGRLEKEKGVVNFAKSAISLSECGNSISAKIIGDGSLSGKLEEIIADRSRIEMTGWIPYEDLPEHLNNTKFLVVPSESEALPTVLIEGMLCGAVPIATSVGSMGEAVEAGETGFLLENNSVPEIVQCVQKVLQRDDLEAISKNARDRAIEKYSRKQAVAKFNMINEEVCRG